MSSSVTFLPKLFNVPLSNTPSLLGQAAALCPNGVVCPGWDGTLPPSQTLSFLIATPVSSSGQYGLLASFVPRSAGGGSTTSPFSVTAATGYYSSAAPIFVKAGSATYNPFVVQLQPDPPSQAASNIIPFLSTATDSEVAVIPAVSFAFSAFSGDCPSPPPSALQRQPRPLIAAVAAAA